MQRTFTWKPEFAEQARRDYEKKATERLKCEVNKASRKPEHKDVKWMSKPVRAQFIRKRQDPKFLERSVRAKKNRLSNQIGSTFDPGHRQGSISTIQVTEKLVSFFYNEFNFCIILLENGN